MCIRDRLQPDAGKIIIGETVRIGYFSQELEEMDPDQRIIDYVRAIGEVIDTPDGQAVSYTHLDVYKRQTLTGCGRRPTVST